MNIYHYADKSRNLLNQLPSFVALSTLNHKLVYTNANSAKQFGFKSSDEVAGIDYSDIKCKAAEDYEFFIEQDKAVIAYQKKILSVGYHCYKDDNWLFVLCEKSLVIDSKGKAIGLINYWMDITKYNLIDFSRFILLLENNFNWSSKKSFSYLVEDDTSNRYKLSNRQMECLFFLLRGKSDKEIARILQLSPRTIESYISEIKFKMECLNRSQIIEKSFKEGLVNMLPKSFL